jgi:phospholipase/carboxylesterase
MAHGRQDPIVPMQAATLSRDFLKTLGYDVEWHEYVMPHSVCAQEIADIGNWLKKILA